MTLGLDADPKDIHQDLLDRSGEALMTGDFELMKGCFALPQGFSTFDGERVVETHEQLEAVFHDVRDEYARKGVTRLIRTVIAAKRVSAHQIQATHMAHLFAGNTRITKPYPVFAVCQWTGSEWRVASSDYAVEPGTNHSRVLSGTPKEHLQSGQNA